MERRTFIQTLLASGAATKILPWEALALAVCHNDVICFSTPEMQAGASRLASCAPMTLDRLPLLPHNIRVDEFSSYNRKGNNGDSGYFLYKDAHGAAVIFDAKGPGCVRSFWQTAMNEGQALKFYFDGETQPRYVISCKDLYEGKHPLFPTPLVSFNMVGYCCDSKGNGAGNCFVPIPFAKSLKIVSEGGVNFYHFIYESYPYGTPVTTFTGNEDRDYLQRAFEQSGEDLQPPHEVKTINTVSLPLEPEGRVDILKIDSAGTVTCVVVEGDASDQFLNSVEIEMQWDESTRPDVRAPLGMFFGSAVRPEQMRSLPARVEKLPSGRLRLTSYFRMPFWRNARISLVNRDVLPTSWITARVNLMSNHYPENDTGYFCALYEDGRTTIGRDWLFADAIGTGWFVGVVQTMNGGGYWEGNEHFVLDGASMPQINGTGTEDYYLACFWPNRNFNLPFSGCVGDVTAHPGPACYYRFHLEAPIPFYRTLDARIQHGGNSEVISHYRSLGFLYLRKRPFLCLTDLIDVASATSEFSHSYHASESTLMHELDAAYIGNNSDVRLRDSGRTHSGGEIRFKAATLPNNDGIRLRRRLDQNGLPQAADVYVDGDFAGTWYHSNQNTFLRWYDSEFDLPASLTRGKNSINIRLVIQRGQDLGPFTDFRYEVLTQQRLRA